MTESRLRFAPSPTGNVHIGNIRVAIFNWLYARHCGGRFLLRIEDTDRQRSTPEAIANLLRVMEWLGLDFDEAPIYQSEQSSLHQQAAERLLADGWAYRPVVNGDSAGQPLIFRIPMPASQVPGVTRVGPVELGLLPGEPVRIDSGGIQYALPSRKGKPVVQNSCLAGMSDLVVLDAAGNTLFSLEPHLDGVLRRNREHCLADAATMRFTRYQIAFQDLIKGELAKPLDSMRDLVIVRGDGSPVFHLANVCDDIGQGISHILRGDDHVENTYRHLFLFHALGRARPQYGHLPMIVNDRGKPYSKRDGDAFVGEFRDQGYLAEALFNYLTLLGWSPGDDREKLARRELVSLFSLERVQQTAAQVDLRKLENLNGQYIAELPLADFVSKVRDRIAGCDWSRMADPQLLEAVAALLQGRTKKMADVLGWDYFFVDIPVYDEAATRQQLSKPGVRAALADLADRVPTLEWVPTAIEQAVHGATEKQQMKPGKLNQPLRFALTGTGVGAGIYETMLLLGREKVGRRLAYALQRFQALAELE